MTEDELKYLGFWLGDGTKKYRYKGSTAPEIFITVGVKRKYEYLESLNLELRVRLHSNKKAKIYSLVNRKHPFLTQIINETNDKNIKRDFNKDELSNIIEGYIMADGTKHRRRYVITTTNENIKSFIVDSCKKCGYTVGKITCIKRERTNLCGSPKPLWRFSILVDPE